MPRLYLIVRFESTEVSTKPSYKTHDISITGIQAALIDDPTRKVSTYTVVDERAGWTYLVALEINDVGGDDVHICYGTLSHGKVLYTLQHMPDYIKEVDKTRDIVARKTPAAVQKAGDMFIKGQAEG
jgi:hypothetical protein